MEELLRPRQDREPGADRLALDIPRHGLPVSADGGFLLVQLHLEACAMQRGRRTASCDATANHTDSTLASITSSAFPVVGAGSSGGMQGLLSRDKGHEPPRYGNLRRSTTAERPVKFRACEAPSWRPTGRPEEADRRQQSPKASQPDCETGHRVNTYSGSRCPFATQRLAHVPAESSTNNTYHTLR